MAAPAPTADALPQVPSGIVASAVGSTAPQSLSPRSMQRWFVAVQQLLAQVAAPTPTVAPAPATGASASQSSTGSGSGSGGVSEAAAALHRMSQNWSPNAFVAAALQPPATAPAAPVPTLDISITPTKTSAFQSIAVSTTATVASGQQQQTTSPGSTHGSTVQSPVPNSPSHHSFASTSSSLSASPSLSSLSPPPNSNSPLPIAIDDSNAANGDIKSGAAAPPSHHHHQRSNSASSVISLTDLQSAGAASLSASASGSPIPHPAPSNSTVHVALMYSNPLVSRDPNTGAYVPLDSLNTSNEQQMLIESLEDAAKAIRIRVYPATIDRLRVLISNGCSALHFSGHGIASASASPEDDQLVFETPEGSAHLVDVPTLSRLLRAGTATSANGSGAARRPRLRLVFVASCHSLAVGEAFLRAGVSHVVCVKREEKVLDRATIVFSKAFYHTLFTGSHSVAHAFQVAQARVSADGFGIGESDKFVYLHSNDASTASVPRLLALPAPADASTAAAAADEKQLALTPPASLPLVRNGSGGGGGIDDAFFPHVPDGRWADVTERCVFHHLPAAATKFLGRNCDIFHVISLLHRQQQRLVTVRGPPGIGKTSLLRQIAHFCLARRTYRAGVLYASYRGHDTAQSVLVTLLRTIRKHLPEAEVQRIENEHAAAMRIASGGATTPTAASSAAASTSGVSPAGTDSGASTPTAASAASAAAGTGSVVTTIAGNRPNSNPATAGAGAAEFKLVVRYLRSAGVAGAAVDGGGSSFDRSNVLLICDNFEDPLHHHAHKQNTAAAGSAGAVASHNIPKLIHALLDEVPAMSILLGSREAIGVMSSDAAGSNAAAAPGFGSPPPHNASSVASAAANLVPEKVYTLQSLHPLDAARLFDQFSPRPITVNELRIPAASPNASPTAAGGSVVPAAVQRIDPQRALHYLSIHPVLKFLGGHPQAITLAAPLLQDRSLSELQNLFFTKSLDAFGPTGATGTGGGGGGGGTDEHAQVNILVASLELSIDHLRRTNPRAVQFFSLMALLPAGALAGDFEGIWGVGWKDLVIALVRASLIVKAPRKWSDKTVDRYYTFPFVTKYAERLLLRGDATVCAALVTRCRLYLSKIGEAIFDRTGTSTVGSTNVYEELDHYELNFWSAMRRWEPVDKPKAPVLTSKAAADILQQKSAAKPSAVAGTPLGASLLRLGGSSAAAAAAPAAAPPQVPNSSPQYTEAQHQFQTEDLAELLEPSNPSMMAADSTAADTKSNAVAVSVKSTAAVKRGGTKTGSKMLVEGGGGKGVFSAKGRSHYRTYAISAIGRLSSVFSAILYLHGKADAALRAAERGASASKHAGDALGEANNQKVLAVLYYSANVNKTFLLEQAKKSLAQCYVLYRSVGSVLGGALTLSALGFVHYKLTNLNGARSMYEKAAAWYKALSHYPGLLNSYQWLGVFARKACGPASVDSGKSKAAEYAALAQEVNIAMALARKGGTKVAGGGGRRFPFATSVTPAGAGANPSTLTGRQKDSKSNRRDTLPVPITSSKRVLATNKGNSNVLAQRWFGTDLPLHLTSVLSSADDPLPAHPRVHSEQSAIAAHPNATAPEVVVPATAQAAEQKIAADGLAPPPSIGGGGASVASAQRLSAALGIGPRTGAAASNTKYAIGGGGDAKSFVTASAKGSPPRKRNSAANGATATAAAGSSKKPITPPRPTTKSKSAALSSKSGAATAAAPAATATATAAAASAASNAAAAASGTAIRSSKRAPKFSTKTGPLQLPSAPAPSAPPSNASPLAVTAPAASLSHELAAAVAAATATARPSSADAAAAAIGSDSKTSAPATAAGVASASPVLTAASSVEVASELSHLIPLPIPAAATARPAAAPIAVSGTVHSSPTKLRASNKAPASTAAASAAAAVGTTNGRRKSITKPRTASGAGTASGSRSNSPTKSKLAWTDDTPATTAAAGSAAADSADAKASADAEAAATASADAPASASTSTSGVHASPSKSRANKKSSHSNPGRWK